MAKPLYFKANKSVGGGMFPEFERGSYVVAYEEGDKFIALPYNGPFEKFNFFYQCPLGVANEALRSIIMDEFHGTEITEMLHEAGTCVDAVWRPGQLHGDVSALELASSHNVRADKQALLLLTEKLSEIFLFVEPTEDSIATYSHKIRELHLLSCMEAENSWKEYITLGGQQKGRRNLTTRDYVRLHAPLYLAEHCVSFPQYPAIPRVHPFHGWSDANPSQSLPWYENYNLSKHNRRSNFSCSTLQSAISSTCAAIVMFSVRHGHWKLLEQGDHLAAQISQFMKIGLFNSNPATWYVPRIIPQRSATAHGVFLKEAIIEWAHLPFSLST